MKFTLVLLATALSIVIPGFAQGEVQLPNKVAFNPADPVTCFADSNHKVFGKDGVAQYFSCDGGVTLHAYIDWPEKGKEGKAVLHGIVETEDQANSLTKMFLQETYGSMLDTEHPCPKAKAELGQLKADKNGRPFFQMCGNIWSWGDGRYVAKNSKEAKVALVGFSRYKGK